MQQCNHLLKGISIEQKETSFRGAFLCFLHSYQKKLIFIKIKTVITRSQSLAQKLNSRLSKNFLHFNCIQQEVVLIHNY